MPQITTNTIKGSGEYIVHSIEFATLWKGITGRAVVTEADLSNIKALARFFDSGLAITRNNHADKATMAQNFAATAAQAERERADTIADYYNRNR